MGAGSLMLQISFPELSTFLDMVRTISAYRSCCPEGTFV